MLRTISVVILISILVPVISGEREYSEDAWEEAAKYLQQAMNKRADPCSNFYDHVCGNYGANNGTHFETTLVGKASHVAAVLFKAIGKINVRNPKTPEYMKAIKVFYNKCTSVEMDEKWPKKLYVAISQRIGPLPMFRRVENRTIDKQFETMNPWYLMGLVESEMSNAVMIESDIDFVHDGCQRRPELQIKPMVPSDDEDAKTALNTTEIRHRVLKVAENLGLDAALIDREIDPWLNRSQQLYDEWRNLDLIAGTGERLSLANLTHEIPSFDWRQYFRGLMPDDIREHLQSDLSHKVYVNNKERLEAIGRMLARHDPEVIRTLTFLIVMSAIQDEYFGELDTDNLQLVAAKTAQGRCLEYALRTLAPAMARLYFDEIGVDILQWRYEILTLGRNIFSAFRFLLNNVDWLDSEDKEKIQKKVDSIVFNPGIPSWIGDDEKVMERIIVYNTSLDPFENEFVAGKKHVIRALNALIPDEDDDDEIAEEPDPSFEVNAEYDPNANQINMFLGMMVPPLFNLTYPLPVKYGGLGSVIGHELMHAFDADGIYSGISEDHEWLKPEAFREFAKKKTCLVRQYSRYCDRRQGLCVSGEKTISENIADIDGIKVAYTAYKILTQVVGNDPPIPGMIHYTDDQIFFLAFARTWCSKGTGALAWTDLQDEHTPDKPRVELALRNVRLFAGAFGCRTGSTYSPYARGCSLWGDMAEPVGANRRRRHGVIGRRKIL